MATSLQTLCELQARKVSSGGRHLSRSVSSQSIGLYIHVIVSQNNIVQELCESRGGRAGLSVLTSLLVSVDVKIYCTVLRHWSQLVPNMSHDI